MAYLYPLRYRCGLGGLSSSFGLLIHQRRGD
jgi:hypothetical protein